MVDIDKVAGLCIRERKLLVVHKKGFEEYLALGGKRQPGETDLACLSREVMEEIGCSLVDPQYFGTFAGLAFDGVKTIRMSCYLIGIDGEPVLNPADAINGYRWIGRDYAREGVRVLSMLGEHAIPALIAKDLM